MAHESREKPLLDAQDIPDTPDTSDTIYGSAAFDHKHGEPEEDFRKEEKHVGDDHGSIHTTGSVHSTIADHEDLENANDILRRTYTPKNPMVVVPRSQRRGLFARFSLVAEITNPYDYSDKTKWFITFIVSVAGAAAPVGSAILLRTFALSLVGLL